MFAQNIKTTILDGDKYIRLNDLIIYLARVKDQLKELPDIAMILNTLEKTFIDIN